MTFNPFAEEHPTTTAGKKAKRWKYPWKDMKVGDSFDVPKATRTFFLSSTRYLERTTGMKFHVLDRMVISNDGDKLVWGVRVWRVE